jgi:hypothetical protein
VRLLVRCAPKLDAFEQVDRRPARAGDGVLDRRLELGVDVEDDIRLLDTSDVPRGQLDVVRLRAGRRQVRDVDGGATDLLSRVLERIERRDDLARRVVSRPGAAAREHEDCDPRDHAHARHVP